MTTAHELAADWSWMQEFTGFRLSEHGVVWEEAEYVGDRLRIGRVKVNQGVRAVVRYVDPERHIILVK